MAAPVAIDGVVAGNRPVAPVGRHLVPALRPGDEVVMDNLPCHERAGVRSTIKAAGRERRRRPAYRPDRNPFEKALSELKARPRAAAKRAVKAVEGDLGELSTTVTPEGCRDYGASCGHVAATPSWEPL
jgi:hypothetical protein